MEIIKNDIKELGTNALNRAFYGCSGLTGSVSFPNLTSIAHGGLYCAFDTCSGLTQVHFKASLKGNSDCTVRNMGCRNATVYFDL